MPGLQIIHVDTETGLRGGERALLALARGLRQRGHSQWIACRGESLLARRAAQDGFSILPMSPWRLRQCLAAIGPVIVHAHTGRGQNIAYLASAGLNVRRVATRHVAFPPRNRLGDRWKYDFTCHALIAVSESIRRLLIEAGLPERKIVVIPPGVEVPEHAPDANERASARAHWGFTSDDFVVGHAAAFTPEKGQDVALAAARLLPGVPMILAGEGPLRPELARQAAGLALLPGHLENMREFFAALDLFIMPSRSEGWGLAALEAMAHGVPVLASAVGGLPEIVGAGWLVPPGDPAALALAIRDASSDRLRLKNAGHAARERAARFSIETTVEQTEWFYRLAQLMD